MKEVTMTIPAKTRKAAQPRFKFDHRSNVTRIEVDFFHAGGSTELQRARFQKFALDEAAHVKAAGFDPVRYGSLQTWIVTVATGRVLDATKHLLALTSLKGTK